MMKRTILLTFLIINSALIGGCSLVAPFKPVNSCSDTKNNGAACASVESNLEYSLNKENGTVMEEPVETGRKKKKDKKKDIPAEPAAVKPEHSDLIVEKDELVRLMNELNIDTAMTKRPTMIPPASYRVLILPYSDGAKFYSGRYLYITAGKSKWVAGNYVVSGNMYKFDVPAPRKAAIPEVSSFKPAAETPKKENEAIEIQYPASKEKPVKHRVNAYLLNCRDMPSTDGNAIAVFEQDRVLDIVDKSMEWWKVNFYDMECYVNPKYLYSELEK